MNWPVIILVTLTVLLAGAAVAVAVVDTRDAHEYARWMRDNDLRRRRTGVKVAGIHHGYRGMGLDGRADHQTAIRKHTRP